MLPSTLDMAPSPSTWNPRPSTLDKKIDSILAYIREYPRTPPRPGPLINVIKGFCRLTKIFQAFLILEGILELWLGKKSFVLEMASC